MAPLQPFFNTREARTHLARQRLFECGERPTGLVSEAVIQSWMRCLQQRHEPHRAVEFEPVTVGRIQSVLRRNRRLLEVAAQELRELDAALAGTPAVAVLLDARGLVMHASQRPTESDAPVLHRACRLGVDLSEPAVGTTAPGVVLHLGEAASVAGAEHFAQAVNRVECAAAPVRDPAGRVVAVLDLSVEGRSFGFDAGWLAGRYARGIEYRLCLALAHQQVVVHLQFDAALLDGPWSGLVGIDASGRVAWLDSAAAAMLGASGSRAAAIGSDAEALLGLGRRALERRCDDPRPARLRLPSGLCLWSRCQRSADAPAFEAPDGVTVAATYTAPPDDTIAVTETAAASPGSTLRDADRRLVLEVVKACGGNVSMAARQLGVSRGLIYRHLRAAGGASSAG